MHADKVQDPLIFLLVGKVGAGKSSTANSITLSKKFKTGADSVSVTQTPQQELEWVRGRKVKVVDVSGLANSERTDEDAIRDPTEQIEFTFELNPDGFDAILIVVPYGRLSTVDVKVVDQLKGIFGENFVAEYGVLLITRCGDFDPEETGVSTIEEWCSNQTGLLERLRRECRGRVVFFENRHAKIEEENVQVEKLFQTVKKMNNGPKRYTSDLFKARQKERDRLLVKAKKPRLMENIRLKNNAVKELLDSVKLDLENPEDGIPVLEDILCSVQGFLYDIRKEDMGSGELNEIIDILLSLEQLIQDKLSRTRNVLECKMKQWESQLQISAMNQDMKKIKREMDDKELILYIMEKENEASLASWDEKIGNAKAENRKLKIKMALNAGAVVLTIGGTVLCCVTMLPVVGPTACLGLGISKIVLGVASGVLDTTNALYQ